MTPISRLLKQRRGLYHRAVEQTLDVNEAYLIVHGVMTHAFAHAGDADLSDALSSALDVRAQRLAVAL